MMWTILRSDASSDGDRVDEARRILGARIGAARAVSRDSIRSQEGLPVHLVLESELPTGSFKVRGALYALGLRQAREDIRLEESGR